MMNLKLAVIIAGALSLSLVQAAPLFETADLKPLRIAPTATTPSASAVKEIGGIQYGRHIDIKLNDGITVRLFPAATQDPQQLSKNWYYLPANPRVSVSKDGTPNFSMVRFVTDKSKEQGGVEGAILHFMVEYGLSKAQIDEAQKLLVKQVNGAKIMGAVPLEVGAEGSSFHVISATLNDQSMTAELISSGKAPVMEGQKVAVAARLDQYGATLLAKSLENPTTDISVVFDLQYIVKLPAYDIEVIIDYDMYHQINESYQHDRESKKVSKDVWSPKVWNIFNRTRVSASALTEVEQQEFIDALQESGVVTFNIIQHIPDADKEIVESGLHKLVMESFFDMQRRLGTPSTEEIGDSGNENSLSADEARRKQAAKYGQYHYTVYQNKEISRNSKQTLSLKKTLARYEPYQMVGNIGGWYQKYKSNPKLFTEVNLDDPFFQRREVRFILDNEAYDIFSEAVNYATIKIEVARKGQRPFVDELTVDRKYLEQNGQTAALTYARMGDDAQGFRYAVQWSLRGGNLYPAQPQWQDGKMMAVTLAAPIKPVLLEAETDIDELEKMGIARISVELRYRQFGKEKRDQQGLVLSPSQGDSLVSTTIYRDADSDKLEYRLIYHHKKLGKMEDTEWRGVDGNYIYCTATQPIINKVSDWLKQLRD